VPIIPAPTTPTGGDGTGGWNGGIQFNWKGRGAALRVRAKIVSGQNFLLGVGRYSAYHNGGTSYGFGQFANGWQDLASGVVPQPADAAPLLARWLCCPRRNRCTAGAGIAAHPVVRSTRMASAVASGRLR
jgi:hypothetical protein